MSKSMKECVREINKNKNLKELLPEYVSQSMQLNDSYARLKMMMEYYIYYEMLSEGINPYIESAKDTTDELNDIIWQIFENDITDDEAEAVAEKLLTLRKVVMDKMQVLTTYVDCFVIYEYILNRVQYRFEKMEEMPEDASFAQDVVNFIFGTKDNVAINDNIHSVIGQLPMRMTRSRFFEVVRESISVYKGSDVSSLDSFLYMFRTNAMLYKCPDMDKYFTEFIPILEELSSVDYENITEDIYKIYVEKITVNASKLNDISDLYMQLGQIINEAYIIAKAHCFTKDADSIEAADTVIRGINSLFTDRESGVWDKAEDAFEDDEAKLYWLGGHFPEIEGRQEKIYDSLNMAGAVLDEVIESDQEVISGLNLSDEFVVLKQMSQLNSNSVFAELEETIDETKVTADMADEAAEKIIGEVKELFKNSNRMVRRAIMANTLEKMPVFFKTPQEVADYITTSLSQCTDEAEKYASKQLILDMMQ